MEKTSGLDKPSKQISALSGQPLDTTTYFVNDFTFSSTATKFDGQSCLSNRCRYVQV